MILKNKFYNYENLMKKASPIHVLLHKPLLLTAVVAITLIGAFVVVGQASRYAAHGKEWWFEGVSSCNAFMTFLYLAIVAIMAIFPRGIVRPNRKSC